MKPIVTGALVAAALIAAFVAGSFIEIERDGDISLDVESEGPAEQLGEQVDEAIGD
ncbi:MAG: hypothetical protein AAGE18_17895 [Pseudomonadota bacterium]